MIRFCNLKTAAMQLTKTLREENLLLKIENQNLRSQNVLLKKGSVDDKAYHESQMRFHTVFESSRLGNKIISQDLKILEVNQAMVTLLGYRDKKDIIGTTIFDYSPPEFKKDWNILHKNLWEKRMPSFSIETCLRKRDGSIIWCNITSILFMDNGLNLGYTIFEDITEQHKLRQQKEEFISVASHELKTPITSLLAVLQLMNRLMGTETELNPKLTLLARNAETYSIKLKKLVADLLSSTKLEQGQLAINKSRFLMADLIQNCCPDTRLSGKYSILKTGDLSLEVFADADKIDQVLINFINNAVKYAPESREITVNIERLNDQIKVSVRDQGVGIPKKELPKLFKRYYRVDEKDNQTSGLGLGLYISAEIIKRHGGKIGANSKIGEGSTFWFTIPDKT